jgi:hypothetical protein
MSWRGKGTSPAAGAGHLAHMRRRCRRLPPAARRAADCAQLPRDPHRGRNRSIPARGTLEGMNHEYEHGYEAIARTRNPCSSSSGSLSRLTSCRVPVGHWPSERRKNAAARREDVERNLAAASRVPHWSGSKDWTTVTRDEAGQITPDPGPRSCGRRTGRGNPADAGCYFQAAHCRSGGMPHVSRPAWVKAGATQRSRAEARLSQRCPQPLACSCSPMPHIFSEGVAVDFFLRWANGRYAGRGRDIVRAACLRGDEREENGAVRNPPLRGEGSDGEEPHAAAARVPVHSGSNSCAMTCARAPSTLAPNPAVQPGHAAGRCGKNSRKVEIVRTASR